MAAAARPAELLSPGPVIHQTASRVVLQAAVSVLWLLMAAAPLSTAQIAAVNAGSAQQEPPAQELIVLPVQTRDAAGKPVQGLKLSDFKLQVDGKPQSITAVSEITGGPGVKEPANPEDPSAGIQRFSSTPASGMPPQILIIAVDLINTGFVGKGEAQQQFLKYLVDGLPSEPFELVAIARDGLVQIHPFMSQVSTIENDCHPELKTGGKSEGPRLSDSELAKLSELLRTPPINSPYAWEIAARASLTALRQLGDAYAGVPGRKTVIWLTAGVRAFGGDPTATAKRSGSVQIQVKSPLSTDLQLRLAYDEAFRALNASDMVIYPVDLKLMKGGNIYLANYMTVFGNIAIVGTFETNDGIKLLAAETGGRTCSAAADLESCIEPALADADDYYLVEFSVPRAQRKNGWHKLELTTASGYTVRTRSRYFLPGTAAPTEEAMRDYLMAIARGNTDYSGFAFSVERLPNAPAPTEDPVRVRIRVPASSVVLPEGKDSLSYEIALVGLAKNSRPMRAVRVQPFHLTAEQTREALQKGWRMEESWPEIDAMTSLRYVIRDSGTGKIGSVTIPLHNGNIAK